jgi:hypothetical protein
VTSPIGHADIDSGNRTELLLVATRYFDHFALEAGGGWLHDRLSGTGSAGSFTFSSELVTDAAVAEISPQYRLTERLQAGPLIETLFGPDVSFAVSSSARTLAWLAGAEALYGFELGSRCALRAGARYLTSVGLPGQRSQAVEATLQIGLGLL